MRKMLALLMLGSLLVSPLFGVKQNQIKKKKDSGCLKLIYNCIRACGNGLTEGVKKSFDERRKDHSKKR